MTTQRIQDSYTVAANKKVCDHYYQLSLAAPELAARVTPGQFVHIRTVQGLTPFFRRPFSVYRAGRTVDILYEVVGPGTAALSALKKGAVLDVLGPLGTGFSPPPDGTRQVVMVAGGIGVAPFLALTDVFKKRRDLDLLLLYGARSAGHVFDMGAFVRNRCRIFVATEDGGEGVKGRVSRLFKEIHPDPETTAVYTCGPRPMMAAVQSFAGEHGLWGQASCEEVMACGLGACLGCSTHTKSGYKTVCHDGPVFDLAELTFDQPVARR